MQSFYFDEDEEKKNEHLQLLVFLSLFILTV